VRRYQTAYSELEHLGVDCSQQQKFDTLLKNFLRGSTAGLVELISNQHEDSKHLFDDTYDQMLDHHDIAKWCDNQQRLINPAMISRIAQATQNGGEEEATGSEEERL
jgi:hypothetical protein